ncbi:MAG: peptide chain release factor N(5)-glutamine methyltransferase [Treponema sp.]|nr:peptide chain release factor N(5)-glutamine methyltransferase [Treponema sp.]
MTIQEAKIFGKKELISSPTPSLDAEVILQFIMNLDKTHLLLERDKILSQEQEYAFQSAIKKRKTGLPVAYITNHKEFFGYDFYVTPDVLIPKPDTELLVELALEALEDKFRASYEKTCLHSDFIPSVCDMCAGSGCVGLSILKTINSPERSEKDVGRSVKLSLVDISEKALEVSKINGDRLLNSHPSILNTPNFIQSNLFENIPQSFDLIVTNPPYVPHTESLELLKDGRSEPLLALDGDVNEKGEPSGSNDGLSLIRRLIPQGYEHLNPKGILIMETGEYNAEETGRLFKKTGFRSVRIEYDMNEMPRDVIGVK